MKMLRTACCLAAALLASSCGYHLNATASPSLAGMNSFSVSIFRNASLYPEIGMMVTTAVTDSLEKSGCMRLAAPRLADCIVSGSVSSVERGVLRASPQDSALSSEIGLTVHVNYSVTDNKTGKVLVSGTSSGQASYFNNDITSIQTAEQSALSYAARLAADNLVTNLTLP